MPTSRKRTCLRVLAGIALLLCGCSLRYPGQVSPTKEALTPAETRVRGIVAPTFAPAATPVTAPPARATMKPSVPAEGMCEPTFADALSETYRPGAPVRTSVGSGHVLTGTISSSRDCSPIQGAKLELWPEASDGGHRDEHRATLSADSAGMYRFECDLADHIHMRISAQGYHTIASNAYHTEGRAEGTFDIVLVPEGWPVPVAPP